MRYFSMFSGIGGFELGIQKAIQNDAANRRQSKNRRKGLEYNRNSTNSSSKSREQIFTCVGFSEIDKYAIETYESHFGGHKNYGDATKINENELPDFELLVGGFPCQAFSIAGKRGGFEDTRGTLFFEIARIIKRKQPRHVVLENVKGLLNHDKGNTFTTILQTLDDLGYDAEWQVLNSKHFGVPQNRERVFIIGHLRGERGFKVFPIRGTNSETIRKIVNESQCNSIFSDEGISPTISSGTHGYSNGCVQLNNPTHSNDRVYSDDGVSPCLNTMQGGNRQPKIIAHSLYPRSSKTNKGGTGHLTKDDGSAYCVDTGNSQAVEVKAVLTPNRLEKRQNGRQIKEDGEPSFTITSQDQHGVAIDQQIRRLTPTECERLQGFPDNWTLGSDTQRYKQCGNAVTVNVIQAIFDTFIYQLYNNYIKPNKTEEPNMTDQEKHMNTFEEIETTKTTNTEVNDIVNQPGDPANAAQAGGEVSVNDFSDTAVGDKVKYVRPVLDGTEDVVAMFQVFKADTSEEPQLSQAKTSKYWKVNMLLTYTSANKEGVVNREYISGAKQFVNKDGSASEINFWYDGSNTQSAYLWELVAKANGVEPTELSPRQFVAFLNSKPKVAIKGMDYKNHNAKPGAPKTVQKNMPGEFTK